MNTTNTYKGKSKGFIAIYNPGTLNAHAEVHYNEPYTDASTGTHKGITAPFEDLSVAFGWHIQIFDLETGQLIMEHVG